MSKLNILYTIVIALGIIILAGIAALVLIPSPLDAPAPIEPTQEPISLQGEITCLPFKGGGSRSLECVLGLFGDNGKYYELQQTDNKNVIAAGGIVAGARIMVSGTFTPVVQDIALRDYDLAGTINIASYRVLDALKGI